jgi:organic radical activating enzyme
VLKHFDPDRWNGKPVVLCGVREKVMPAAEGLFDRGIGPVFICDDDWTGFRSREGTYIPIDELAEHREDNLILGSKVFYKLYERVLQLPYGELYSMDNLLKDPHDRDAYSRGISHFLMKRTDEFIIEGLEICLTQRCNLRCKKCSNLMQYFENPRDADDELVLGAFKKIMAALDGIVFIKILGGEALLTQELLCKVLALLKQEEKILNIHLPTNGTLLFSDMALEQMKMDDRITVLSSNYGKYSEKIKAMETQLREKGIMVCHGDAGDRWQDHGRLKQYRRKEEKTKEMYKGCNLRRCCVTLWNDILFPCPAAAHGTSLEAFPKVSGEYISILTPDIPAPVLREQLRAFYYETEYVTACTYCKMSPRYGIRKGVQVRKPVPYKKRGRPQ